MTRARWRITRRLSGLHPGETNIGTPLQGLRSLLAIVVVGWVVDAGGWASRPGNTPAGQRGTARSVTLAHALHPRGR